MGAFDGETAISIRSANSLGDHEPIQSQQNKGGGDELVASVTQEDYMVTDDSARALDLFVKCTK